MVFSSFFWCPGFADLWACLCFLLGNSVLVLMLRQRGRKVRKKKKREGWVQMMGADVCCAQTLCLLVLWNQRRGGWISKMKCEPLSQGTSRKSRREEKALLNSPLQQLCSHKPTATVWGNMLGKTWWMRVIQGIILRSQLRMTNDDAVEWSIVLKNRGACVAIFLGIKQLLKDFSGLGNVMTSSLILKILIKM